MHIQVHSYYSLRYGTLSPEALVQRAAALGHEVMVLTDINNTTGIPDFVKACNEHNVRPVGGMEFRRNNRLLYLAIARNREGMREINEFLSDHNISGRELPDRPSLFSNAWVIYPYGTVAPEALAGNELIGVALHEMTRFALHVPRAYRERFVLRLAVTFADAAGYELHRNLRAIGANTLITKLTPDDMAAESEQLLAPVEIKERCSAMLSLYHNTKRLLEGCAMEFDFKTLKNKKTFTGSRYDDRILLEKLALDGLAYRYSKANKEARERLMRELDIIDKLGFAAYFLITWDIIRYSMSRGFYHVGRGSGANSIVAYCLRITDVDPIELNLYFERFLNPKRSSPPDFDIDYSWHDRDEVQDYVFKRYGKKYTALLGAMSTFKGKSMYRELGKVYGLPKGEIDNLIKYPGDSSNKITMGIHKLAGRLAGFPNIRSIHAGGILVSEEPLTYYTALDMPPKGFPTTQWDMYVAEEIGYEKLDILSQRGIGHIKDAAEIVLANRGEKIDVYNIRMFKEDIKVQQQMKEGETNGCFYIESPAMRGLLKKLRCDNYLTLVAASSIIRPGVARSGMMKEYIRRYQDPEGFSYIHPVMKEHLSETFGVMVYQEDVLKICHHFAGLDLADADVLRRAMSGKARGKKEFYCIVDKYFNNCKQLGYPEEITKEVWRQIASFAGYAFSKAHSASYAVESFQSLWLKVHYPLEFMTAVINNFGGFYPAWVYFNEARRKGAEVVLPCVNNGDYLTAINGVTISIGFVHVQNLERNIAKKIVNERINGGKYLSLEDFIQRVKPGQEQLTLLIRVGALRFTGKSKAQLLWECCLLTGKRQPDNNLLFNVEARRFVLPELLYTPLEDAYDELELIGFPVTMSWFDLIETKFRGDICAKQMVSHNGEEVRMIGQLVTQKYVRTVKEEIMQFGTFIDVTGEFFDTVHFPVSLRCYPFRGNGVYLLRGKIVTEFGFPSLEVDKMAKMPLQEDPRNA